LGFAIELGSSPVLVDGSAQDSFSPYRAVERDGAVVVLGWVLIETLV